MKIKYILPFSMLLLATLVCTADEEKGLQQEKTKLYGKIYYYPLGLEGSPYLNKDWQIGNIVLESGKVANEIKIRLNIIQNDLVFYNESLLKVFTIDKNTLRSFSMKTAPGATPHRFIKYTGEEIGFKLRKNDLIEVLHEGNITLYVKHLADVINSNNLNSKNKVYPKEFYFLKVNGKVVEIRGNARSVIKYFPDNKREIKKMIKANRLRKRGEQNLVKLIALIDSDYDNFNFEP
ncbi:MAG: hypothetical protein K9H26_00540 [Prolixibacteraceae bacterium]|nr:hypothetical protein [Prolixibacteraceae bacterium]